MSSSNLRELLKQEWPELGADALEKVVEFHKILLLENEVQNLTRLVSPTDFVFGHAVDVRELLKSKLVSFAAMDLGSGCGVPGLLAALVSGDSWVLAEAEGRKADFLKKASEELGVQDRVQVFRGRAEGFLKDQRVESVVARAVGPVDRIFGWIRDCSTWNKLVLLKGPGWNEEWVAFEQGRNRRKLIVSNTYEYSVGPEMKKRVIVELKRVPRGTIIPK